MKVLQVNCVYGKGSTGKITQDIHRELLARGHESVVCYGRGAKTADPFVYKVCAEWYAKVNNLLSRFTGLMYGGCFFSTNKLISVIKRENPDVVHLHCVNGYFVNIYRLITWLKKHHVRTILTLHAEFIHTANCSYAQACEQWRTGCEGCTRWKKETRSLFWNRTAVSWQKMKKAFENFEELQVVGVSDWIKDRAQESAILGQFAVRRLHNGVFLEDFRAEPAENEREHLFNAYGIPKDKNIVLHVTPNFASSVKGGNYILELAERLPEDYQMVVVGSGCTATEHILWVPFVEGRKELAAIYRAAAVFVIASTAENYPTVCIEANCCGTPVVGFDIGGIKETIAPGMGSVVIPFDVDALTEQVLFWSKCSIEQEALTQRRRYCSKDRMTEDYLNLYGQEDAACKDEKD